MLIPEDIVQVYGWILIARVMFGVEFTVEATRWF